MSGDQQYELYVNGIRAGKGQAYCYPDTTYYETLDVTALLRPGAANALAIVTNWQGADQGTPCGRARASSRSSSIHHADGRRRPVGTDGSWRVRKGAWLPGTQRDLEGDLVDYTEQIDGPGATGGLAAPGLRRLELAAGDVLGRGPARPGPTWCSVRTRIVEAPVHPVSLTVLSSRVGGRRLRRGARGGSHRHGSTRGCRDGP